MNRARLNQTGARLDLDGVAGRDIELTITAVDISAVPVPLTSAGLSMRVWTATGREVAVFTAAAPVGNKVKFSMSSTATAALGAGEWRLTIDAAVGGVPEQWTHGRLLMYPAGSGVDLAESRYQTLTVGGDNLVLEISPGAGVGYAAAAVTVASITGLAATNAQEALAELHSDVDTAQSAANTAQTTADSKVSKSGDTMSGHLTVARNFPIVTVDDTAASPFASFQWRHQGTTKHSAVFVNDALEFRQGAVTAWMLKFASDGVYSRTATAVGHIAAISALDVVTGRVAINDREFGGHPWRNVGGDLATGWAVHPSAGFAILRRHSGDQVEFLAKLSAPTSGASTLVYTLPAGYRINNLQWFGAYINSSSTNGGTADQAQVRSGNQIWMPSTATGTWFVRVTGSTVDAWPNSLPGTP